MTRVPKDTLICSGLPPVCSETPRVLVLGSFPSVLSLIHTEYYGNPKNRFWAVLEEVSGVPAAIPYKERCLRLTETGIALWDVVLSCSRAGSADSRIRDAVPNDIPGFVRDHPTIRLIALNGAVAGKLYTRLARVPAIASVVLPSTSPAHAAMPFADKVRAWACIRRVLGSEEY